VDNYLKSVHNQGEGQQGDKGSSSAVTASEKTA
jgi:hypothetical protein